MFGITDFLYFLIAFFITFPICTVIHLLGHLFFLVLFKASGIKISLGCGRVVTSFRFLEIRKYYFWYGRCTFKSIKTENKFSKFLVLIGGSLFNILSVLLINFLIAIKVLEPIEFWNSLMYFSVYFGFMAFFPMRYPDGSNSDGMAAVDVLKEDETVDSTSDIFRNGRSK